MSSRILLSGLGVPLQGLHWESERLLRIGHQNDQDVILDDPLVSPRHAEVVATEKGWAVRDVGSSNHGTSLNGVRLGPGLHRLKEGDVIRCGSQSLFVTGLPGGKPEKLVTQQGGCFEVEAAARCSWQQALETLALHSDNIPAANRDLAHLVGTGYHLCLVTALDEMLQAIADDLAVILNAQRCTLLLFDDSGDQLVFRAGSHALHGEPAVTYDRTLGQRAVERGESLLFAEAAATTELQASQRMRRDSMSSVICALLRTPRRRLGVVQFDRGSGQEPFTPEELYLADALAASVSVGIEGAELVEKERTLACNALCTVAGMVEQRDGYSGDHARRVTDLALMLAAEMQVSAPEREQLRLGTPLLDIGKMGIEDALLQKRGKLTAAELASIQAHAARGAAILEAVPELQSLAPMVRHHHEHWDGTGYPDNLAGEDIPLVARIVAVAEAFDAMISGRPYRAAVPVRRAWEELQRAAGKQFDPQCVQAFFGLRSRIAPNFKRVAGETTANLSIVGADEGPEPYIHCATMASREEHCSVISR
jgi:HD-GYP domain-containing protein (c-di-GMP phosphodiesterase class II)